MTRPTAIATGMSPPPMMMPIKAPDGAHDGQPEHNIEPLVERHDLSCHRQGSRSPICVDVADHRTEIDFHTGTGDDGDAPGFGRRLMLVDPLEIFINIYRFFDPLADSASSRSARRFRSR